MTEIYFPKFRAFGGQKVCVQIEKGGESACENVHMYKVSRLPLKTRHWHLVKMCLSDIFLLQGLFMAFFSFQTIKVTIAHY